MLVISRPDGFSSPDSISLAGIRTVIIVVLHPWELRFYQFPVGRISAGPQNYSLAGMESHGTAILRIYRFGSNDSSIFSDQFCQRRIQKRSAAQFMEPVIQRNNEAADPKDDKKKDGGWFNKKAREMEAVKAKLDAAEQNAAQAKEQLLRMAAEYDNYRKRSTREADQKFNDGISFAVNQIIPILDTLDMAANAPTTDENYKKGVVMTLDKAAKALEALHVEEIEALGKPFDPNFMNAVQQIPAPDGQESGTVITVYQKGYKLGDKIVRHATVVVAE